MWDLVVGEHGLDGDVALFESHAYAGGEDDLVADAREEILGQLAGWEDLSRCGIWDELTFSIDR